MAQPSIPTRYTILLELLRRGARRSSELVDPTGLTLQGVSYQLKQLEAEGLAVPDDDGRRFRLTDQGVEALHEHFLGLKAFVDLALSEMLHVEECVALADEALSAGDEVGLFMEDGRLVARKDESPSMGRVRRAAAAGEPVVVAGLTGVVDLEPGTVHVVRLPHPTTRPAPDQLEALVASEGIEPDLVVVAGLEAEALADGSPVTEGVEVVRFAPAHVARSAAQVGLDVLVLASWDTAPGLVDAVREGTGPSTATAATVQVRLYEL